MHNCVPNGTHKHENLDTIRHDNILNVITGANSYSTPIESIKLKNNNYMLWRQLYYVQNL
jgi:hypothetical protein